MKWFEKITNTQYILIALGLVTLQIFVLYLQGHIPICSCGEVKLWYGLLNSPGDSQHVSDWYTFSHIIHGFVFYFILRTLSKKRWPPLLCFVFAIGLEVGWEILENSPIIINRYRETASLMYYGDSMLNSVSDVCAMALGFFLASKLRVSLSILLVIAFELFTLYIIRDNLTLNIVMLAHPFEVIRNWQLHL